MSNEEKTPPQSETHFRVHFVCVSEEIAKYVMQVASEKGVSGQINVRAEELTSERHEEILQDGGEFKHPFKWSGNIPIQVVFEGIALKENQFKREAAQFWIDVMKRYRESQKSSGGANEQRPDTITRQKPSKPDPRKQDFYGLPITTKQKPPTKPDPRSRRSK